MFLQLGYELKLLLISFDRMLNRYNTFSDKLPQFSDISGKEFNGLENLVI